MNSPPPSGSLQLLASYGYDDDDDDADASADQAEQPAEAAAEPQAEQPPSFRVIGDDGSDDENENGSDNGEVSQPEQQEARYDKEDEDKAEGESDVGPPAAKRQRSASSSGGQFNFEISDDEAAGEGHRDDDEEDEAETAATDSAASGSTEEEAASPARPQQHRRQSQKQPSKLPKVDSLVSYGLGAYESEGEDDEAGGHVVDGLEASSSQDGSNSEREENGDPTEEAATRGQQDDDAAADLKEPPPPPPKMDADGPDADSVTVSELTDEDRTAARQKANKLLLSLSSGGQAGASQLTLPPPPQAPANRGVEEKIAGILQRQRQEPAFSPASLITKNKSYRNPSIYEKLMSYYGVDDRGTNFHPGVFDPYIWDKHSYYDSLLKVQTEAEKKRVGASGKSASATGEPSGQTMPASRGSSSALQPLMQLPAKKPQQHHQQHHHQHHHRASGSHAEAGPADATSSGARRSKWDAAPAASGSSVGTFLRKKL